MRRRTLPSTHLGVSEETPSNSENCSSVMTLSFFFFVLHFHSASLNCADLAGGMCRRPSHTGCSLLACVVLDMYCGPWAERIRVVRRTVGAVACVLAASPHSKACSSGSTMAFPLSTTDMIAIKSRESSQKLRIVRDLHPWPAPTPFGELPGEQ